MSNFNESIETLKSKIDGLNNQQAIMNELATYLKNIRIQHEYEASLLRTVLQSSSDDFTDLLLKLTDGPDQVTHTVVRNIYFYMTANFGSGLFNSNLHLYQLLVSGNLFVVIPVLVGAVFVAGYYMARKWYELRKQREMSQFDYAIDQFLKTNPDMTREDATLLMTKQVAKGLLSHIENIIESTKEAEKKRRAKNNNDVEENEEHDNQDKDSRLERFFARIRNSSVSSTANSAWMTLALVSMTAWIIFATGIIAGLTITFPISAGIVVGMVAIAVAFRAYKYFSSNREKAQKEVNAKIDANESLDGMEADLANLLDPADEMKARHQQRIKDFMAVDFEGKKLTLQSLFNKKAYIPGKEAMKEKAVEVEVLSAKILADVAPKVNNSNAINEAGSDDEEAPLLARLNENKEIPALNRLTNSWWNKDSRTRAVVTAILGASFGFMSTSFLFAPLTNTVIAILAKVGVAATAATITALSLGVAAIVIAAFVGIYLGVYYHYARKQQAKENSDKLDEINQIQDSFKIDSKPYTNTSKNKVMQDLLVKCDSLKEIIKSLQAKYPGTNLPDLKGLPGYENHAYFTEMSYQRSLGSKIDDVVQVGLAGLDGLGTGFFMPRANYVTTNDAKAVAVAVLGLAIAMAVFHPPLLIVFIMAAIMGTSFMVFKALRARYNQAEVADQTFLDQFDLRLEYLQKEVEYLELYKNTLVNLEVANQITKEESASSEAGIKSASVPSVNSVKELQDTSSATDFFQSGPDPASDPTPALTPVKVEDDSADNTRSNISLHD